MPALSSPKVGALSDGPMPERPSALPCEVCGWHALHEAAAMAPASTSSGDRLICTVCGAHRVDTP